MLGPSRHVAKGKSTCTQPDRVDATLQRIYVPRTIKKFYHNMFLSSNAMFLNDVPFLTSISENFHYGDVGAVDGLNFLSLENGFMKVMRYYSVRGFRLILITVDPQFNSFKDRNLVGVPFNVFIKE